MICPAGRRQTKTESITAIMCLCFVTVIVLNPFSAASAQQQSLTLEQILTALRATGGASTAGTIDERNKRIEQEVLRRRVAFVLTEETERSLRRAGATDALIKVIRQSRPTTPVTDTPLRLPSKAGAVFKASLPGGVTMNFAFIPAGSFDMGNAKGRDDEKPVRRVKLTQGFYMGQTEVTQKQWQAVMGTTLKDQIDKTAKAMGSSPSIPGQGPDYPMYYVSWPEVQEFLNKLNLLNDGFNYRLPTEAEWEYAVRAGSAVDYSVPPGELNPYKGELKSMAWCMDNSQGYHTTQPVGQKQPNAWNLYDMYGNAHEWVNDWYGPYNPNETTNPKGPASGKTRVFRGSVFNSLSECFTQYCRADCGSASNRREGFPAYRYAGVGFRVVRE
jgi:formylglycine-generating enzyme required for sulfatase activity